MPSKDLVFRFLGVDAGAGREFDRMAGKSASLEKSIGKLGLAVAGMGVALGVEAVRAAAKFQTAMELIHTQAGATQAEVNKMSKAVLSLAGPTATAPETLAAGLYHLESAGFHGTRALKALTVAAEGAKLGGANLEDVTNALNATLVSGIKGSKDFTAAMGALNATVGAGDMRMQDLAEAMGTGVLAAVKGFGLSLNDVGAALATFGDNNIRGADAATQLRMAVLFMAKPAATAKSTLKELGMTSHTLANDMGKGGLGLALKDLHERLIKAGDTGSKMGQVLLDMFGHKAGTGIAILEQQYSRFLLKQDEVHKGSKNFASDWGAYTQTFGYQWGRAQAAFQAMVIQLGTKLLPIATKAMHWIGTTGVQDMDKFGGWISRNKTPIEDIAKALAGIAAFRFATNKLNDVSRLLGGRGALGGGVGGILGSAKPVPVYVTNPGFGGGGGIPGAGGGEPMPIPGGGSGIPGIGKGPVSLIKSIPLYAVGAQPDLGHPTLKTLPTTPSVKALEAQATAIAGGNAAARANLSQHTPTTVAALKAWIATWKQGGPALHQAAANEAVLNHYLVQNTGLTKGNTAAHRAAVKDVVAEFRTIPGAMRQVAADAKATGLTIGQMLDAGITIGIKQGSGTINLVSTQVIDGVKSVMSKRAQISSPSKVTAYIGQMLAAGLAFGMRSGKKGVGQAASQMMDTIFGTVIGAGSLGNVSSMQDSLGASGGSSMADILAFTGGQRVQDRAFARNLALARKHGLSKSVAQQIAQLGPDQGSSIAASIAGASRSQIRRLNADEAAIGQAGHQIAGVVSLSDTTIAKLGHAIRPRVSVTSPAQLDRHNGKKIVAHG